MAIGPCLLSGESAPLDLTCCKLLASSRGGCSAVALCFVELLDASHFRVRACQLLVDASIDADASHVVSQLFEIQFVRRLVVQKLWETNARITLTQNYQSRRDPRKLAWPRSIFPWSLSIPGFLDSCRCRFVYFVLMSIPESPG